MSGSVVPQPNPVPRAEGLTITPDEATIYAEWFACLADPTRVRLLHAVATATSELPVGKLAELVGISQATCSHHVRKLGDVGFINVRKQGTTNLVSINQACCTGLPMAADIVMGSLSLSACCNGRPELPADVHVRAMTDGDWDDVLRIYTEGIATGDATFETETPSRATLQDKWLPDQRWVAEIDGTVVGWTSVSLTSGRDCYHGVGETSVYVADGYRSRGVGKSLVCHQVDIADQAGIWTLQTSIFPENRTSIALHHAAGYRTLGIRERIAQHHGTWRDTVILERRSPSI